MDAQKSFMRARTVIEEAYQAKTKIYHAAKYRASSSRWLRCNVVRVANWNATTNPFAQIVIEPQTLRFFTYAEGNQLDWGGAVLAQKEASYADTSLAKARSTDDANDVAIEGIGLAQKGLRARLSAASLATLQASVGTGVGGAAWGGDSTVFDPSSLVMPAVVSSPFMLENALMQAVVPHMSAKILLGGNAQWKLGDASAMLAGMPGSYLRTGGDPTEHSLFKIPEGVKWSRDGQPDSELEVQLELSRNSVTVPVEVPIVPFLASPAALEIDAIFLDMRVVLSGISFRLPSSLA